MRRALLIVMVVASSACGKVPLTDVHAEFSRADATWFADEETLFVFYRVDAEQGLGTESRIEISYRTDGRDEAWTPLAQEPSVHTHVPVDCGAQSLCGSTSLHVAREPREVGIRLRYHKDGEMSLPADVMFHVVGSGPPHTNRSLVVYGVFDGSNTRVQWRARHQFPALRNEEVQALGLRRFFRVAEPGYGDIGPQLPDNPYGYAFAATCPEGLTPLAWPPLESSERAAFAADTVPVAASAAPGVCGRATVLGGRGTFEAAAVARKNPEVRPAFPSLHSPIRTNTEVGFVLRPCTRTISEAHLAMQEQRLLLSGATEICLDGWQAPGFADVIASRVRARIEEVRAQGADMVLALALHHDDTTGKLAALLEQALEEILPFERDKSSPRVSGAFVLDSYGYSAVRSDVRSLALWCPANGPDDLGQISDAAARSCPLMPDIPELKLGPFSFSNLPILPSRAQYVSFIAKYSDAQAGKTKSLVFLAPERTPISQNVPLGDYGVATFFNNEAITASPEDAFSYCASGDKNVQAVVFRTAAIPAPQPLQVLPEEHEAAPQGAYSLGLVWDFPFLARLDYEVVLAGAASAFSLTVPFGVSTSSQAYYGTQLWLASDLPLSSTLLQCTRFCDHPTFDSAGVYNVGARFRAAYLNQCFRPTYPAPGDGGFPHDP